MCEGEIGRLGGKRSVTDNGSLGKGTVKGSVFPRGGMRYLRYGGKALVHSSTGYFSRRSFTGGFNIVCSLYGTVPGIQTKTDPMICRNIFR